MRLAYVYWVVFLTWLSAGFWRRRSEGSRHFQDIAERFLLASLLIFVGWHIFGFPF